MPSVKAILRNCRRDNGCLRWKGGCNQRGYPYVYDEATYKRRRAASTAARVNGMKPASHVVWEAQHGPVPEGHRLVMTCRHRDCLEIGHMAVMTWKDASAFAAAGGAYDTVKHQVARVANARKNAKLTPELAQQIRVRVLQGNERRADVANDLDVSESTVAYIVRGARWAQQLAPSSIFNLAQQIGRAA